MVETVSKFGTWQSVFGRRSSNVKDIASDLRSLIVGLHPETVVVPRKADNTVSFGFGIRKKQDSYCYLKPQPDAVNIGFWWGSSLTDINHLLHGRGKFLRHTSVQDTKTARSAKGG